MNIKKLQKILSEQVTALHDEVGDIDTARTIGNLTDKIIRTYRVKLEYRRLRGCTAKIPELE